MQNEELIQFYYSPILPLTKHSPKDVLYELKQIPPVSVDVFIDSCAVTHFAPSENTGWKQVAEGVSKALKPDGKFILSSDVDLGAVDGEFISPQRIIEIMKENDLNLMHPYKAVGTDFDTPWPVVTLAFKK